MKYKVGDLVQIVSKRPSKYWNPAMDKYFGEIVTITAVDESFHGIYYRFSGDDDWYFYDNAIAGYAKNKIVLDIIQDL